MAISNSGLIKNLIIGFAAQASELTKDILLLRFFGIGAKSDAFLQAYMMVTGIRNLLGEGPLSKIFIPLLPRISLEKNSKKSLFCALLASILIFSGFAWLFISTSDLLRFFSPKNLNPQDFIFFKQTIFKMFPAIPILFLGAIFGVLLLSKKVYWQMPAGPLVFNSTMIICLFLAIIFKINSQYLFIAVIAAAVLKLAFRGLLLLKIKNFSPKPIKSTFDQEGLKFFFFKSTFWQGLSGIIARINYFLMLKFGAMLPPGQLTLLFFAHKVIDAFFHSTRIFFDNTVLVNSSQSSDIEILKRILKKAIPALGLLTSLSIILSRKTVFLAAIPEGKLAFGSTAIEILSIWAATGAIARMQRNYFYATGRGHLATAQFLTEISINCSLSLIFLTKFSMEGLSLTIASAISSAISMTLGFGLLLLTKNQVNQIKQPKL